MSPPRLACDCLTVAWWLIKRCQASMVGRYLTVSGRSEPPGAGGHGPLDRLITKQFRS